MLFTNKKCRKKKGNLFTKKRDFKIKIIEKINERANYCARQLYLYARAVERFVLLTHTHKTSRMSHFHWRRSHFRHSYVCAFPNAWAISRRCVGPTVHRFVAPLAAPPLERACNTCRWDNRLAERGTLATARDPKPISRTRWAHTEQWKIPINHRHQRQSRAITLHVLYLYAWRTMGVMQLRTAHTRARSHADTATASRACACVRACVPAVRLHRLTICDIGVIVGRLNKWIFINIQPGTGAWFVRGRCKHTHEHTRTCPTAVIASHITCCVLCALDHLDWISIALILNNRGLGRRLSKHVHTHSLITRAHGRTHCDWERVRTPRRLWLSCSAQSRSLITVGCAPAATVIWSQIISMCTPPIPLR